MTTFNGKRSRPNRRPVPDRAVRECYHVLVECSDEREQRRVYEELIARGLKCRVLTL